MCYFMCLSSYPTLSTKNDLNRDEFRWQDSDKSMLSSKPDCCVNKRKDAKKKLEVYLQIYQAARWCLEVYTLATKIPASRRQKTNHCLAGPFTEVSRGRGKKEKVVLRKEETPVWMAHCPWSFSLSLSSQLVWLWRQLKRLSWGNRVGDRPY